MAMIKTNWKKANLVTKKMIILQLYHQDLNRRNMIQKLFQEDIYIIDVI